MNTLDEIRKKAAEMELYQINFLDERGLINRDRRLVVKAELIFIDQTIMYVPFKDLNSPEGRKIQFKLRPRVPDA